MSNDTEKKSPLANGSALISLMMVLVISMVLVVGAIGVVAVANGNGGGGASSGGGTTVSVTLTEFKITMEPAVVPPGKVTLQIHNAGAAEHNVAVLSLEKRVSNIPVGGNATLSLGNLSDAVELICEVAGHKESGMKATLGVSADGASASPTTVAMTNEQMDAAMEAVAKLYPAKTAGVGNQELAPTIAADGTKEFALEAKIVDWEVEPGKFVKGWTYNGQIPGPILRANVGDKVRIKLKNSLPESTSMHLHGIRVPNAMDGVDPYTQKAQRPGETFTYEFTATEEGVGMYHSHHNAQVQIPNGLAGAIIIGDWKAKSMRIAGNRTGDTNGKAEQETVMVLNDAGTIGLSLNGKSFPATSPYTMKVGESIVVHYYNEGLMTHPMHMHQPGGLVVAKDGYPLSSPFMTDTLNVAPGERWTVVYTAKEKGVWAWHCHILNHAETPQGMKYMVTAVIVS